VNLATKVTNRLTYNSAADNCLTWSPDGTKLTRRRPRSEAITVRPSRVTSHVLGAQDALRESSCTSTAPAAYYWLFRLSRAPPPRHRPQRPRHIPHRVHVVLPPQRHAVIPPHLHRTPRHPERLPPIPNLRRRHAARRLVRPAPWRDVVAATGWLSVGAVLLAGVMALSVVGAAATLYALGWLLHKVLVASPILLNLKNLASVTPR
jgi:hypothetical protein